MDSVHEGKKPFPCNQCDVSLSRADSLAKHIAEVHELYKNHQCNVCGKEYYGKFRLNEHIRSVHEGNKKSFQCNICGVEVLGSTGKFHDMFKINAKYIMYLLECNPIF